MQSVWLGAPLARDRTLPKESDSIFHSGEAGSPAFPDVSFETERTMWWAEFDSVGEEAVRGYVARGSYTPTGMEIARQWLARREFEQLREDVESIKALVEQAQETASEPLASEPGSEPLWSESESLALQVDANSHAIAEIAANAKRNARTMVVVGTAASVLALCAIVMVLASSRPSSLPSSPQVASNTQQASVQPPKQAVVQPPSSAVPPAETPQALPPEQASAVLPEQAPAIPPENASAIPNVPKAQASNAAPIDAPDLKLEGRSVAEVLALIADKVGGEGAINFRAQFNDTATGRVRSEQLSYRASNVTIDPNRCQVGYSWHVEQNGRALSDSDRTVDLRLAQSVRLTSIDAESGRRFSMRADPKVYVVQIARRDNASGDTLYFRDQGTAARVGAAARHAVALCGRRR